MISESSTQSNQAFKSFDEGLNSHLRPHFSASNKSFLKDTSSYIFIIHSITLISMKRLILSPIIHHITPNYRHLRRRLSLLRTNYRLFIMSGLTLSHPQPEPPSIAHASTVCFRPEEREREWAVQAHQSSVCQVRQHALQDKSVYSDPRLDAKAVCRALYPLWPNTHVLGSFAFFIQAVKLCVCTSGRCC